MYTNPFIAILDLLKIKHTKSHSNRFFNEHPYNDSLFGLSDMLLHYNIENSAIKVENKEDIYELEVPFIAHFHKEFVVVNKMSETNIYIVSNDKNISLSMTKFRESWSGIALIVKSTDSSIEPNYIENRKIEVFNKSLLIFLLVSVISFFIFFFIKNRIYQSNGLILLLLLNILGIYICSLLIRKKMKMTSKFVDKVCSLLNKSSCNSVLQSPASKLIGTVSWSEIGFSYFISNGLVIILAPELLPFLSLINVGILPYSFWSIWYQKVKIRQWCFLCLIVQIVIWSIFMNNVLYGFIFKPNYAFDNIFFVSLIYLLPFAIISIVFSKILIIKQVEEVTYELNSFKMNPEVFKTMLAKQKKYHINRDVSSIIFGKPQAPNLITVFTNPHCYACGELHNKLKLLLKYEKQVSVQYVFTSFNKDLEISNKFLIAIFKQKEYSEMINIYDQWFSNGKYNREKFFNVNNVNIERQNVHKELVRHNIWKNDTKLKFTPTVLINGYQLPKGYKIEDLIYFIRMMYPNKVI